MSCETGNCPKCKVEIGYIDVAIGLKHLFVMYTDERAKLEVIYRGGPVRGSKYSENAAQGLAKEFAAPKQNDFGDPGSPMGLLITHRQEGFNGSNPDYLFMEGKILLVEGPEYCGLDPQFTRITRAIGMLGKSYDLPLPPSIDEAVDNSNATVRTILHEMGLPERKPDVVAPGWGTIFTINPQQMMPIGSVSSARMPGAMGSIPAGSETNALDVISEQNSRSR